MTSRPTGAALKAHAKHGYPALCYPDTFIEHIRLMPSIRDRIARNIIERQLRVPPPVVRMPGAPRSAPLPPVFPAFPLPPIPRRSGEPLKVGILGVGAAGLYAAMILEGFKEHGYTYEILEAEPDDGHVGGRLWTYKFSDSPNDYYVSAAAVARLYPSLSILVTTLQDRGAMRFPKIDFMKPVFDLFDNLCITDDGLLIPYILSNDEHNILYYNGIRQTVQEVQDSALADPFNIGLASHADDYVRAALGPFIDALAEDFESGWQKLMEYDQYSTRAYMNLVLKTAYTASGIELNYTDEVVSHVSAAI